MEKEPLLPSLPEMEMLLAGLDLLSRKKFVPHDFIFEIIKDVPGEGVPDAEKILGTVKDKIEEKQSAHQTYIEDVQLLQAKIINLKRFLVENAPVKDVYELLRQQYPSTTNE